MILQMPLTKLIQANFDTNVTAIFVGAKLLAAAKFCRCTH